MLSYLEPTDLSAAQLARKPQLALLRQIGSLHLQSLSLAVAAAGARSWWWWRHP